MTKRSRSPSPQPQRTHRQQTSHPAAADSYPPWVLLVEHQSGHDATEEDAKTVAVCSTSAGDPIRVSLRFAALPAESRICVQARDMSSASVTAAYRDSVLFVVSFHEYGRPPESFVYRAGAGGSALPPRPPFLFLVPPCYHGVDEGSERHLYPRRRRGPRPRYLNKAAAGLTRRGEDDLVVAFLGEVAVSDDKSAELLLLRHGEWTIKRPAILTGEGNRNHAKKLRRLSSWESHKVVSIIGDDGLMCWVNFRRGLMFSNVFDETPTLQYVPLPRAEEVDRLKCWRRRFSQDLCATSDGTVKLVRVSPRCCCGGAGATHCRHSKNAYTIRTWTLNMDGMAWVMDGMVDATELWALDAYKSLPRIQLACPTVSLDEPHVIFFRMSESFYVWKHADKTEWVIEVDTRSKVIRSLCRYEEGRGRFRGRIPSRVSGYFNSSARCSDGTASPVSRGTMDSETPPLVIATEVTEQLKENGSDSTAASQEEMILATLQQIPGLAREHILKAYSLLSCDSNGSRRLKSLLGLPVNMRKDWLLMEIRSSEACSRCLLCTCTANSQHD